LGVFAGRGGHPEGLTGRTSTRSGPGHLRQRRRTDRRDHRPGTTQDRDQRPAGPAHRRVRNVPTRHTDRGRQHTGRRPPFPLRPDRPGPPDRWSSPASSPARAASCSTDSGSRPDRPEPPPRPAQDLAGHV